MSILLNSPLKNLDEEYLIMLSVGLSLFLLIVFMLAVGYLLLIFVLIHESCFYNGKTFSERFKKAYISWQKEEKISPSKLHDMTLNQDFFIIFIVNVVLAYLARNIVIFYIGLLPLAWGILGNSKVQEKLGYKINNIPYIILSTIVASLYCGILAHLFVFN